MKKRDKEDSRNAVDDRFVNKERYVRYVCVHLATFEELIKSMTHSCSFIIEMSVCYCEFANFKFPIFSLNRGRAHIQVFFVFKMYKINTKLLQNGFCSLF